MDMPDAQRPRASAGPGLDDPDLTKLHQWFKELRDVDADVTQYALGIVEKHFSKAGLDAREELELPADWHSFCRYLRRVLMPLIREGTQDALARDLLEEIVDYSLINPTGSPATRLADLLEQFLDPIADRLKVQPLLPAKARAELEAAQELMEAREEDQRRIWEQSGY